MEVETRRTHPPELGNEPVKKSRVAAAPRWTGWVPRASISWALGYGAVRIWWAIDAPTFPPPQRTDLIVFTNWGAVALCVAAAGLAFLLRRAAWSPALFLAGCGISAALLVSSALVLLDIVAALFPGQGVEFHLVAFLSRATALAGGVLIAASMEAYRRRCRSACLFCGRKTTLVEAAQLPQWAWWGAYVAIAGCLVRLGAQVAVGFGELQGGGWSLVGFEAGFLLAGTVLPLALVHGWGRVFPRWLPLLAGHRVPRWLLLGPGAAIGILMTAYFGFTLFKIAIETLTGTWEPGDDPLPLAFFWVAVPAYLAWGLGLSAAAIGYHRVTRPRCRVCGR